MNSSPKSALIVSAVIAIIILIIWMVTAPSSQVALVETPAPVTPRVAGAVLTLVSPIGGSAEVGQPQHITWTSQNYNAPTVSINVLRQVSVSPASYELVRTISSATVNDGDALWVPAKSDVGTNIVIEIGCAVSDQGCQSTRSTSPIAVANGVKSANTASVYASMEWDQNR